MKEKTHSQIPDSEEKSFIQQIGRELSISTPQEVVRLVSSVLQALRQTFTLEQANRFINILPDFFKLAFITNWERNEKLVAIHHLDELVNLVMERDAKSSTGLFRNEVHTLSVVILTLKKLHKLIDLDSIDGISPLLLQELKGLPSEAAA